MGNLTSTNLTAAQARAALTPLLSRALAQANTSLSPDTGSFFNLSDGAVSRFVSNLSTSSLAEVLSQLQIASKGPLQPAERQALMALQACLTGVAVLRRIGPDVSSVVPISTSLGSLLGEARTAALGLNLDRSLQPVSFQADPNGSLRVYSESYAANLLLRGADGGVLPFAEFGLSGFGLPPSSFDAEIPHSVDNVVLELSRVDRGILPGALTLYSSDGVASTIVLPPRGQTSEAVKVPLKVLRDGRAIVGVGPAASKVTPSMSGKSIRLEIPTPTSAEGLGALSPVISEVVAALTTYLRSSPSLGVLTLHAPTLEFLPTGRIAAFEYTPSLTGALLHFGSAESDHGFLGFNVAFPTNEVHARSATIHFTHPLDFNLFRTDYGDFTGNLEINSGGIAAMLRRAEVDISGLRNPLGSSYAVPNPLNDLSRNFTGRYSDSVRSFLESGGKRSLDFIDGNLDLAGGGQSQQQQRNPHQDDEEVKEGEVVDKDAVTSLLQRIDASWLSALGREPKGRK